MEQILTRWVFNIQKYFEFHKIPKEQRLQIVGFNLQEDAVEWFQYIERKYFFLGWMDFLEKIKIRFGPS